MCNGCQISWSCYRLANRRQILSGRYRYVINKKRFPFVKKSLECTSSLSSFLTNLNGSVNVFIYFLKHRQFVLHLCHPDSPDTPRHTDRSPSPGAATSNTSRHTARSPSPGAATSNRMITTATQNRIITVTIMEQCYLVTSV